MNSLYTGVYAVLNIMSIFDVRNYYIIKEKYSFKFSKRLAWYLQYYLVNIKNGRKSACQ